MERLLPHYDHLGALRFGRYDELELLRAELDQEDRTRESLDWSNGEMEKSIAELETYLRELDDKQGAIDDNEWKVRFESQAALNKQLTEQKDWLETELAEARRKLTTGSYPEAMNFNLDALNESELLRLVKHLERMRNDFYSTLRDTEWKLDKESKEFHHFDEMRRVYKADLKHANSQIERLKVTVLDPSLYPGSYYRWLDAHSPTPKASTSKSPTRKQGGSKGRGERSPSRSPTRSKSRAEKSRKKKEEPPPSDEEVTTPVKSDEVEGEDDEGGDQEEEEEEEEIPPAPSPKKKESHHDGGGSPSKSNIPRRDPSKERGLNRRGDNDE